ncbi:hypothetical protein FPOA_09018 [Fusarium poae]|uniref:Heterokaryon incompatibility domain-containing protein n=1 Tax=Fusarium poae TaxID=36050 RepID=A0A1B8AQM2_FUSPO|nr:hypothetical protein FPOA_09018 [Fusarium poae]
MALADAPPYYAVSHAWIPDMKSIPSRNQIPLSKHLTTLIRRLQKFGKDNSEFEPRVTYIWLDTICINQDDVHERSLQVAMMGSIYRQSVRTLVWLGEMPSPSVHLAWQLIADIYTVFEKENPSAKSLSDIPIRTYNDESHVAIGLPPLCDSQWIRLKDLVELRWFSRIWVVQEVVLSQRDPIIIHGDYHYAWEPMGWAVSWLRRSGYFRLPQVPEQLRNIDSISNLRRARTSWPLDALMSICQVKFHATDQRDKVYGLLGLSLESEEGSVLPEELKPDYTIDVPTLYQRVARYLLKRNRSLAILTRAKSMDGTETRKQRVYDLDLRSWCPDWSDFKTYNEGISTSLSWIEYSNIFKPASLRFPNYYQASGGLEANLYGPEAGTGDSTILQLGGFVVDRVAQVCHFKFNPSSHRQQSNEFDTMISPVLKLAISLAPASGTLTWIKKFVKTTTASQHLLKGKSMDQITSDGAAWLQGFLERQEDDFQSLVGKQECENNANSLIRQLSTDGIQEDYIALVRNFCYDRSFIITTQGRMGIVPSSTCHGDTVSVILGGGVPYIIRADGNYWNLVGESYVDGLMNGETIERHRNGDIQEDVLSFK